MKKIGVTGAQNTGKTTFIRDIAKEIESHGHKTIILDEVARQCPMPINEDVYLRTELWIALMQIAKEIEASSNTNRNTDNGTPVVLLTDRTMLDNYAFSLSYQIRKRKHYVGVQIIKDVLNYWLHTYDMVFYLKPLPGPIEDDGVRSTDQGWQKEIDRIIRSTIQHHRLNNGVVRTIHTTNREERVEQAMLHLTPLLKNSSSRKKTGYFTHNSNLVQKQIPGQEAIPI